MNKSQRYRCASKGFALIALTLIVVVLIIIVASGYFVYHAVQKPTSTASSSKSLSGWNSWTTKCAYSFSYPKDWHVSEKDDPATQCTVVILAPDGQGYQTRDESGLIVEITQVKKGYKTWNFNPVTEARIDYTMNTIDDDIKFYTDMGIQGNIPGTTVTIPAPFTDGPITGKYVLLTNYETPDIKVYDSRYVFAWGDNIYDVHANWHQTYSQDYPKYNDTLNTILGSLQFN